MSESAAAEVWPETEFGLWDEIVGSVNVCSDCGGSGYASDYEGNTLGTCSACKGDGLPR